MRYGFLSYFIRVSIDGHLAILYKLINHKFDSSSLHNTTLFSVLLSDLLTSKSDLYVERGEPY
jgi:hypothetical protein